MTGGGDGVWNWECGVWIWGDVDSGFRRNDGGVAE